MVCEVGPAFLRCSNDVLVNSLRLLIQSKSRSKEFSMKNLFNTAGKTILCVVALTLFGGLARATDSGLTAVQSTIVYDRNATSVAAMTDTTKDLWITLDDLKKATRFEVKPAGVCRDELCFPLPKSGKDTFTRKENNQTWFNLSAFARLIHQPIVTDEKHSIWLFGERSIA